MIEDRHFKPTATIRLKREESEEEKKTNRPVITTIIQHPCGSLAKSLPHETKYGEEKRQNYHYGSFKNPRK